MALAIVHSCFPKFRGFNEYCLARQKYNNSMSSVPLRIRDFRNEDLEELYRIDHVCFPADIAFSRMEIYFFAKQPGAIARIAEKDGRILGFILAHREKRSRAHVLTLDVVPNVRRSGVGTSLMQWLHEELRKQKVTFSILEVGVLNRAAQRLYEKLEYKYRETLVGYYRGREDAYRMVYELTGLRVHELNDETNR
jgi:[ribosomal protein S18]-alanine N-acetyltransferase